MVNVYKGYKIDSDDMQFTLFNETEPSGKGKSEQRNIRPIGYFNSFGNAVKYIIRLEISKEISENDMDLAETVRRIEAKYDEFERILLSKTRE